ncbi:hypothetical protein [Nitrospirillum sp. BR 11163]|uniref:hypothetical protein n=1 Tax=Nitrospirillum sp. BR 11163 TaxID=3104323 RepID=UPI002AFE3100|nr:hypothetical protein [Nitrospirillum sp. BR 11163]MEA1671919.1 hypothetical protein [Nitrospirillum sp. BR 11163]
MPPTPSAVADAAPAMRRKTSISRRHKFSVGQTLDFTPHRLEEMPADGRYEVVSLMPSQGKEFLYRIRSTTSGQERMVRETQLQEP